MAIDGWQSTVLAASEDGRANAQEVKEICMFYVQKCAGTYADNKTAARYVHQMADEIILQLAGVATEIKKNRGEPEMFAALLEEWQEHFPPSLGALGTPKAIAALLAQQTRDLKHLHQLLEAEKKHRDRDVNGILHSMDAQLHAYRGSVLHDRRQQQLLCTSSVQEVTEKAQQAQQQAQRDIQQLQMQHQEQLRRQKEVQEAQMAQLNRLKEKVHARQRLADARRFEKQSRVLQKCRDALANRKRRYGDLRAKYHVLARSLQEHQVLVADLDLEDYLDSDSDTSFSDPDPAGDGDDSVDEDVGNDDDDVSLSSADSDEEGDEEVEQEGANDNIPEALRQAKAEAQLARQHRQQIKAQRLQRQLQQQHDQLQQQLQHPQQANQSHTSSPQKTARRNEQLQQLRASLQQGGQSSGGTATQQGAISEAEELVRVKERLQQTTTMNRRLETLLRKHEALVQRAQQDAEGTKRALEELAAERNDLLRALKSLEDTNQSLRRALHAHLVDKEHYQLLLLPTDSDVHAAAAEESKGDLENPDSSLTKPTKDEKKVALSTTTLHTLPKQLPTAEHLLEAHQRGTMVSEPLRTAKEVAQLMQARRISADRARRDYVLVECHTPHFLGRHRLETPPPHRRGSRRGSDRGGGGDGGSVPASVQGSVAGDDLLSVRGSVRGAASVRSSSSSVRGGSRRGGDSYRAVSGYRDRRANHF